MAAKVITRPPRTPGHAQRDALIRQFAEAALMAIVSTNGSVPDADIQIVKGAQPGEVMEAWLTAWGERRLAFAQAVAAGVPVVTEVTRFAG